jgi:hypothetical protein
MSIISGQQAVSTTTGTYLFTVPPGAANVVLATSTGTVYVGSGSAVSTTNCFPVSTYPVHLPCYPTSAGEKFYAVNGSTSSTVSVGWFISTAQ